MCAGIVGVRARLPSGEIAPLCCGLRFRERAECGCACLCGEREARPGEVPRDGCAGVTLVVARLVAGARRVAMRDGSPPDQRAPAPVRV